MLRTTPRLRAEHRSLVLLVCIAIGLSVWHGRAAASGGHSWPESAARRLLGPVQVAFTHVAIAVRDAASSRGRAGELARENRALEAQVAKLQTDNARLHEYFRRYKAMTEQLGLGNDENLDECPAIVVSRSGGNWARRIISSGSGMIYPKGLRIGEVVSVDRCLASDVAKRATIRPAADFGRLEYVIVLRR